MASRKLNIVIAGAGIGGLTTAIALRRSGHKVTVYEKASLSHEIGQGITISPNGGRILRDLGLDFEKARVIDYIGTNVNSASSLESIAPVHDASEWDKEFGIRMKNAYRIDLHSALLDLACRQSGQGDPVKVITSAGVDRFDGDNGYMVLESGETVTADLVVAADGVKSSAAAHINGPSCPALDSGDTIVYRFTLPMESILADPLTKPLLDAGPGWVSFNVASDVRSWLVRYWWVPPARSAS